MRPVVLVFIFFAAMMGLLAAYMAKVWLDSRQPVAVEQQAPAPTGMVQVLVAARPIASGTRLTRDDFKWMSWPKSALQDRFVDESKITEAALDAQQQQPSGPSTPIVNSSGDKGDAAVGLVLIGAIARRQLLEGEPIGLESVVQPGDRSIVSAVLAPGMRAYSVPVQSEGASAGFINPGDRVDIMLAENMRAAVTGKNSNAEIPSTLPIVSWATETVLYNVKVLAVDQQLTHDVKDGPAVVGKIMTFEVSPFDAEKLFAAQQLGVLSITLRSLIADRVDSARSRDIDNPTFHPFTSDKDASRALTALTGAAKPDSQPDSPQQAPARTIVRVNRGGAISEQSF